MASGLRTDPEASMHRDDAERELWGVIDGLRKGEKWLDVLEGRLSDIRWRQWFVSRSDVRKDCHIFLYLVFYKYMLTN